MHRTPVLIAGLTLVWAGIAFGAAAAVTPQETIAKSIAHHDPSGVWDTGWVRLGVHTTYSEELAEKVGGSEVQLEILLSPGHEEFSYTKRSGDDVIDITVQQGQGSVMVNGNADVTDEDKERLRLREATLYRDYCEYLYGMPMKLRDPGVILPARVQSTRFDGRDAWSLRVTYDPEVGGDIWYFYFDQTSFALIGYKFYHDESLNDGEYITLTDEVVDEMTGLRLPKERAWYYNADDRHLATDDIVGMSVSGTSAPDAR